MHEVFLSTDCKCYNVRFRLSSMECNIFISVLRWASSDRHFIPSLCGRGASACWWQVKDDDLSVSVGIGNWILHPASTYVHPGAPRYAHSPTRNNTSWNVPMQFSSCKNNEVSIRFVPGGACTNIMLLMNFIYYKRQYLHLSVGCWASGQYSACSSDGKYLVVLQQARQSPSFSWYWKLKLICWPHIILHSRIWENPTWNYYCRMNELLILIVAASHVRSVSIAHEQISC